ncbi:MAG: hypothetical protein KIT73_01055 [Burkholderiales bacterium]|nr:hypothetical protein [Burkholderiales bacterium]
MIPPKVSLGPDGIVRVDYGSTGVVTPDCVQAELAARLPLKPGPQLVLMSFPGVWRVDVQAAAFMASAEFASATVAVAAVVESSLGNLALRVFELYHRPPYPLGIFARDDDAESWLLQIGHGRR